MLEQQQKSRISSRGFLRSFFFIAMDRALAFVDLICRQPTAQRSQGRAMAGRGWSLLY